MNKIGRDRIVGAGGTYIQVKAASGCGKNAAGSITRTTGSISIITVDLAFRWLSHPVCRAAHDQSGFLAATSEAAIQA